RLRFSGPKTSIICSPMTSLKTSIKTITYLSDIGCLEIQGASLHRIFIVRSMRRAHHDSTTGDIAAIASAETRLP
ncbi:hypothetical protein, partial [Escherichia coli]|uniref:hypothetical protein n=1 Tax=Escherichia coli TaxID=562 RepID=UPI003D23412D